MFMCCISCCGRRGDSFRKRYPTNYILLFSFTACEAIVISIICLSYNAVSVGIAAGMTALVVLGLSAFACSPCAKDFTGCMPWLAAVGISYLVFRVIVLIFVEYNANNPGQIALAGIGCGIFSLYIVFDTQKVIGGRHRHTIVGVDEYVYAALSIYLDIINMFLFFLQITASRD